MIAAGEMVQISVRVPVEHVEALERIAREADRTVSAELRRIIRQHLNQAEREGAEPVTESSRDV